MFACVNHISRNAAGYARQNFLRVACYERLARVRGLGTGVDGISCECEAVLLAPDSIGYNHRGGAGKRSQWDRKEKEYALGGKPQTET